MYEERQHQGVQHLPELRAQLKKAVTTLKQQPFQKRDRPNGVMGSWPILPSDNTGTISSRYKKYHLKSTPKQISHMQYWLDHMLALDDESRRIVMARAAGIPWRRLEEMDGRSHTTLRKIEKAALLSMLPQLKAGREKLPRDFFG